MMVSWIGALKEVGARLRVIDYPNLRQNIFTQSKDS